MATLSTPGVSSQSYYLRFSSHSAALSRSLLSLLSESYCTDVHISTGHQSQTIRAHKIILSAFSPYFKALFSSLPSNQFPVIIIREISYDILRTIIEFCYRGEILVSRDKLDDIVSAAKFLQIEGAKDFILPKQHQQQGQQPTGQQYGHHNNTTGAAVNTSNRMQIDLQNMKGINNNQKYTLIAQQPKQMSLLSKVVQKAPTGTSTSASDMSESTHPNIRHSNDNDVNFDHNCVKQEIIEEEVVEEEEEDLYEGLESSEASGPVASGHRSGDKSGMFSEFEDQSSVVNTNNKSNNESNRNSEDSCVDDEPMDTSAAAAILARVPPGTSVSTTGLKTSDANVGQHLFKTSDNMNVPTNESEEELVLEEEEEYEDEFDEEEEDEHLDATNPLDICNANLSETEGQQRAGADMSSATARAIAASTLASFNTNIDVESESQSSQYSATQSVTYSERRGRGRPPKYEMGGIFTGQPTPSSIGQSVIITAQKGSGSQTHTTTTSSQRTNVDTGGGGTSSEGSGGTRSRRGRPPSMPEELLRSLTGRLDKAHHKCPHCPQIYYGYHAMRDHITSVHLNSGEKYICNLCNKEYTWRITLRKHLKFHHGVHPDQVQNT